jgi:hypothetical protein
MSQGLKPDRYFDACFEMYDGDKVVAQFIENAEFLPKLAQALPKYLGADVFERHGVEIITLASGEIVQQALLAGLAPIPDTTRQLAAKSAAKSAKRGHSAPPAGGLFDETARNQLSLF